MLACAAVLLPMSGCARTDPPQPVPAWPEADGVERITAAVPASDYGPELAEFDVPQEYVPALIRFLSPPQYHEHPRAKMTREVGRLGIACRDGRTLDVRLILFGKEPILFTIDGVPCIRGGPYNDLGPSDDPDQYAVESLILEAFLRAVHSGDSAAAQRLTRKLDRSAGRKLPGSAPSRGATGGGVGPPVRARSEWERSRPSQG
jgi:hypothetical protein